MIRHMFKLIWNRKGSNFLIITEVFLSFIVLFALGTMIIQGAINYSRPLGFLYENIWILSMDDNNTTEESRETIKLIKQELKSFDQIEYLSLASSNLPFSYSSWSTDVFYNEQEYNPHVFYVDDEFADAMEIPLISGRWFSKEDDGSRFIPIVLNRLMKEEIFEDQPAVGKILTDREADSEKEIDEYIVVGVIDNYRYKGEFDETRSGFFIRNDIESANPMTMNDIVLAVKESAGIEFEQEIIQRLNSMAKGWSFNINRMEDLRNNYLRDFILPLGIFGTIAGFLVFNVALGLFGVLWYSINRRRGEIGLRRAVGAECKHISRQVLGESLAMATFAIILGFILAIQAPILGVFGAIPTSVYMLAILTSAVLIYLIVSLCAIYPSRLASRIQPAAALHND